MHGSQTNCPFFRALYNDTAHIEVKMKDELDREEGWDNLKVRMQAKGQGVVYKF